MTVKEMIDKLRLDQMIEFRNEQGIQICRAKSSSEGVNPYLYFEVIQWFPSTHSVLPSLNDVDFVLYIKEKDNDNTGN